MKDRTTSAVFFAESPRPLRAMLHMVWQALTEWPVLERWWKRGFVRTSHQLWRLCKTWRVVRSPQLPSFHMSEVWWSLHVRHIHYTYSCSIALAAPEPIILKLGVWSVTHQPMTSHTLALECPSTCARANRYAISKAQKWLSPHANIYTFILTRAQLGGGFNPHPLRFFRDS